MAKKVVVGMSGGVDSSVAAYLLKKQGYDVIGVTMQIWQDEDEFTQEQNGGCCGLSAVDDARRVADRLEIPYYVMNFKQEFRKNVMDYFTAEYLKGRTPNPCIACNRYVKWEALLDRSLAIGADYIATGHYARVEQLPNGRYAIKNSVTAEKDQTYALYNLTQAQLSRTLMPVGDYHKDEIRQIAEEIGLMVAHKKDSMEICFIPDDDYAGFIDKECGKLVPPGNFVSADGKILGRHKGITHYTIGQRKGLGIAMGYPVFVTEIRPETNEVVLGSNEDVFTTELYADHVNFMSLPDIDGEMELKAKIRYSHSGSMCKVTRIGEDQIHCGFEEPVHSIRRQSEGIYAILHFLAYEKKQGRKYPEWEQRVKQMFEMFLKLQNADGSFPRKFRDDFTIVDKSGGSTPSATLPLVLGYKYFKDKRYLASARKTAEYLEKELISKADYFSSTLDANCEDKEASLYAATATYYLSLITKGEEHKHYADLTKKAAYFALSWYYLWDVPFAPGQMLGDIGMKTRGWGNVSVENNHIDVFVFEFADVLRWLSKEYKENRLSDFAEVISTSMRQLLPHEGHMCGIAKVGYYPEVVQHTNWDYGKNGKGYYNDIFAPGWTVASLWELYTPGRAETFLKK